MKNVFLSDIHIGINAPTNLYQTSTNQANLKRILKRIQNDKDVNDLVILGDWLDLWMYGTTTVPPTVQQIIAANPAIFIKQSDDSGDFVTCLENINGTIHYVNGNHDITVTSEDINGYFNTVSTKQVQCSPEGYNSGCLFAEHGHRHSMVCKPYADEPLPIGYFITRAGMEAMRIKRRPLPALDVVGIQELISYNGMTFAQAILTNMASQIGLKELEHLEFVMPDGSKINGESVADKYPNLSINDLDFLRADVAGSLDISAESVLMRQEKGIVLFGHTHIKELKDFKNSIYGNSGFLCANAPTNGIPVSTFIEVEDSDIGHYKVSLIKLTYQTGYFSVDNTLNIMGLPTKRNYNA